MWTIWKYPVRPGINEFDMPRDARILSAGLAFDGPCVWALVEDRMEKERRYIFVTGTGHNATMMARDARFLGTILIPTDPRDPLAGMVAPVLAWHTFVLLNEQAAKWAREELEKVKVGKGD